MKRVGEMRLIFFLVAVLFLPQTALSVRFATTDYQIATSRLGGM